MTQPPEQQYHATPPASMPQQSFQMCPPSRHLQHQHQHQQYYFQPQEMEIPGQPDRPAPHDSLLTFIPPQTNYHHSMMASNSRTFLPDN
jgi:hypothetical protein